MARQLSFTEPNIKPKHYLSHRSSKVDIFSNTDAPISPPIFEEAEENNLMNEEQENAQRKSINITRHTSQGDVDTFDHILEVTAHHDAVYAYYYMDENNKVNS